QRGGATRRARDAAGASQPALRPDRSRHRPGSAVTSRPYSPRVARSIARSIAPSRRWPRLWGRPSIAIATLRTRPDRTYVLHAILQAAPSAAAATEAVRPGSDRGERRDQAPRLARPPVVRRPARRVDRLDLGDPIAALGQRLDRVGDDVDDAVAA